MVNRVVFKMATVSALVIGLYSCNGDRNSSSRTESTFSVIHTLSEGLYIGDGSWGVGHDYRMALRDASWRAYVYGEVVDQDNTYLRRNQEALGYLMSAQADGGAGVFGFPADEGNPEFGEVISHVIDLCSDCVNSGWIVSLPGDDIAELYYDHGYALTALARGYLRTADTGYIDSILSAANWALDKPIHNNINYLSALSKGLSYAFLATGNADYIDRAIYLHEQGIFPGLSLETGSAVDSHNQQLEYHGFIVSGIIALKKALPENHTYHQKADQFLAVSVAHMRQRNLSENGDYGQTWPGTNLLAWYELEELRPLTAGESDAKGRCITLIESYKESILEESGFRLQKTLYINFFIGLYE